MEVRPIQIPLPPLIYNFTNAIIPVDCPYEGSETLPGIETFLSAFGIGSVIALTSLKRREMLLLKHSMISLAHGIDCVGRTSEECSCRKCPNKEGCVEVIHNLIITIPSKES